MRTARIIGLLASAAFGGALGATPAAAQGDDGARCEAVTGAMFDASNVTALYVDADAHNGLPAYCEVKGTLHPTAGSSIGVVYRLPVGWNGKLLGIGGGGWAGNVTLMAASEGLKQLYATAQTDGGHPSTEVWDNSWAANADAATDFAYRAINRMTVAGKALVKSYYGRAQDRAYFNGCSTGGRMALMEAQRFAEDYDGIIAGAPVYSLQVQSSAVLRNNGFAKPGAGFTPALLKLVNDSVLKACDAKDGLADGLIAQPRACGWKPAVLACKPGQAADTCLSKVQVSALDTMYAGIRAPDGSWAQLPLSKGGETLWSMFINTSGGGTTQSTGGGMPGLTKLLFGDRQVDFSRLDPNTDVPEARASAFARMYEATNPDLSAFFARGGRLILWHGESDPGPSPVGTLDYAKAVAKADAKGAAEHLRTYLLPGVGHCRGGSGADLVDWLGALDAWVDKGQAPGTLIATRDDKSKTRPVCVWPQVAHYSGKGDANDPASWHCVAGAKE
ncbi:MAG TPA: tannase/feruloyl esterase family alpha/beta hydrolase [Sphingobium sp.]|nr:tannase/feruloyl esterase family alpha/beta hydrolase [Sphingobium sp.]